MSHISLYTTVLVFLHSGQLQSRKYKSIKEENIQSAKQVSITMKKISEYKVQKRRVVLRFTQVKFPKDSSHELTVVKVLIPMFLLHMAPLGMLKHIKTSQSFIKGSLSWNRTQAYNLSHSFSTSITNLLTGRSRYQRVISVVPDVPSTSLMLMTNSFLWVFIATIFAVTQLLCSAFASMSRTIYLSLKFLLMEFHFCRHWYVTGFDLTF